MKGLILEMKKILALAIALITAAGCISGCGEKSEVTQEKASEPAVTQPSGKIEDLDYIKKNGELVIGYTVYEPMNYTDESGKFVGFDTEFAEAVCEKLGVEPNFVEINWDTKEVELNAKNIDCIWNGFTIDEERKQNLDFSKPYIENKQVVVIKAANKDKYTDASSLSDANLVAETSSAGEDAIKGDSELQKAAYVAVPKQTDALLEVKSGTADAAVLDYTLAFSMVGEGTDYSDLMIIEGLDLGVEEYGIGFRKGSDLVDEVDKIIDELKADGTMEKIAETYELTPILIK
ncbi:MAG: transporter substrate-binding domain-containing protein [Clostridia bacterium]|nr:transporter substrate-binding domain-containing protein [Clostridia bacterium]